MIQKVMFFAFTLIIGISAHASEITTSADLLTSLIQSEMNKQKLPAVTISVLSHGKTVYRKGFGVTDTVSSNPATPNTKFHLASLTKSLVATGLMQLVAQGVLDLDEPITTYFPKFRLNCDSKRPPNCEQLWKSITLRELLSHTAGLSRDPGIDYWNNLSLQQSTFVPNSEDIMNAAVNQELVYAPGEHLKYSNFGFNLAGLILAEKGHATGATPEERIRNYLTEHILKPLQMDDSGFSLDKSSDQSAAPYGLLYPSASSRMTLPWIVDSGGYVAAYGLVSSASDMEKYLAWLLREAKGSMEPVQGEANLILDPASFHLMTTPVQTDPTTPDIGYGLGLMLKTKTEGGKLRVYRIYHSGSYSGYKSFLSLDPALNFAVIVMSNAIDANVETFANLAYQVFAGDAPVSAATASASGPQAKSSVLDPELAALIGVYDDVSALVSVIDAGNGQLAMKQGGATLSMTQLEKSANLISFRLGSEGGYNSWIGEKVVFEVDQNSRPLCALAMRGYRMKPLSASPASSTLCP